MLHVRKRGEVRAEVWCGNLRDTGQSESLGLHWKIILKWLLRLPVTMVWTGLIWLMTETASCLLWIRQWNCAFHKEWWVFFYYPRKIFFFKKGSASWSYLMMKTAIPTETQALLSTLSCWHHVILSGVYRQTDILASIIFLRTPISNLQSPLTSSIRGAHNLHNIGFHFFVPVGSKRKFENELKAVSCVEIQHKIISYD